MLLYYITDRQQFAGGDNERRATLLRRIAQAASVGADYVQLREKDLSARELERLAREAVRAVQENSQVTRLLINSRTDVAIACGADGVHLPSGELPASEVRALWMKCCHREPLIGVSAHSVADVRSAQSHGADFALLGPIFEKAGTSAKPVGLVTLQSCCSDLPRPERVEAPLSSYFGVLALGGVNLANAALCIRAGAAGVAGIRLFQTGDIAETVGRLRGIPE